MTEWFECKVSYTTEDENGKSSKVAENYLVDATSFIEAETRLVEKVSEFIPGEFKVEAVKREKVYEIFRSEEEGDTWFKNKVEFITLDEKSGKEKKTAATIFLQSSGIENVVKELNTNMKDSMCDYSILSVTRTKILDVFEY